MFIKPRKCIAVGLPYKCGCKTTDGIAKQIYFGVPEKEELHTKKLLKAVSEGVFGEEWQSLLRAHPDGSVDCRYDLYVCDNCSNWENEETMDFYVSCGETKHKTVNYYPNDTFTLLKKYVHVCGKCGAVMHQHHLIDYAELKTDEPTYMAAEMNKQMIYNLHLKCGKCKEDIVLLNIEMGINAYSEYIPEKGNK